MATLTVYNRQGEQVGQVELDPRELAPRINKQLLHDAVVMYQNNLRQGSAKTKSRSEVAGSTRKLYRQKGTGHARMGSRRTNLRRGGGHCFAKRPRDWSYRLPRKALRQATRMAVASKVLDEQMVVLDQWGLEEPKTREVVAALRALGLEGKSVLIVTAGLDPVVYRSARNIPRVDIAPVAELNALRVLRSRMMLITREAVQWIAENWCGQPAAAAG